MVGSFFPSFRKLGGAFPGTIRMSRRSVTEQTTTIGLSTMVKKTARLPKRRRSRASAPRAGASGRMPAEPELVAAVTMLDGEPGDERPSAPPPFRRSLVD
jgi:hypothetical protein